MILGLLAACLPHGAAGRPVEEATVWRLELGAEEHTLTRQYARSFEDGSAGWLVCVASASAPESCAELRTFDTGEVLVLRGWLAWPAALRAAALGMWPVLSPRVGTEVSFVAGWPAGRVGRDVVRLVGRGAWTREGADWTWAPGVSLSGPAVWALRGAYEAHVRLAGGTLASGDWRLTGEVCERSGACRPIQSVGRLERTGVTAARPVAPCPDAGPAASRAPLCVGSVPVEDPVGAAEAWGF